MDAEISLPGYSIEERLYKSSRTLVYRGMRQSDRLPVVLKLFRHEYPTWDELAQFRHQYAIAASLDGSGIVKHLSLEPYRHSYVLVMADFGGITLREYTQGRSLPWMEVLTLAGQITEILHYLYQHRIIYQNLNPTNLLINPQTQEVKLIDFALASLLPKENQEISNFNSLAGRLAYLSPEQTGRTNRGIDYRSDYYSLGVTLFELLAGQLPFQSDDPMELVHCHLAQQPPSLVDLNSNVPLAVAKIVAKLMAKNAEDRYQTPLGLKFDLQRCLEQQQDKECVDNFLLGTQDVSDRFLIPEKLYGRELEAKALLEAFDRTAKGQSELMLVVGGSGIGKTALVNEVRQPIVRQRGYFIKGKFDQIERHRPFSGVVQAFRHLMAQLLGESQERLVAWQRQILEAVGANGQVIVEVLPELERIIGQQPSPPELSGNAAQNRFNLVFQKFARVFTASEHPLVMFLDDLQWADSASLHLLKLLLGETGGYFLAIAAYRDNEVHPTHPLLTTLDEIRSTKAIVNTITLASLQPLDINRFIADTLNWLPALAAPLAELVERKTQGNPFFINQFLQELHQNGCLRFNTQEWNWQWDLSQSFSLSNDVVESIAVRLQKLPVATQEILKLAACIGSQFDLTTLAIAAETSPPDTAANLWSVLQEGLILPTSETYKFFPSGSTTAQISTLDLAISYQFLHDLVQQAAYSLIPPSAKPSFHLKIGQLLLSYTAAAKLEENIFPIVNQLNYGIELITRAPARAQLVQLNLIAGKKAKATTAYVSAVAYFTIGIKLLPANSWQTDYRLTLELYEEAIEAAYLSGNFQQMQCWQDILLSQAATLLDRIKTYEIQIAARVAQNQLRSAIDLALSVLSQLGIEFPPQPTPADWKQGMAEVTANLAGKPIASAIDLPVMSDPNTQATLRILLSIDVPAYLSFPALLPLTVCKQVNLSLLFGNAPGSAKSYANYSLILCAKLGDVEAGYEFGQLALKLLEKLPAKEIYPATAFLVNCFIRPWKEPLHQTLNSFLFSHQVALETGGLSHGAFAIEKYCQYGYYASKPLTSLAEEMAIYGEKLRQFQQTAPLQLHQIHWQSVLNLIGQAQNPCRLIGEVFDETITMSTIRQQNNRTALYYLYSNQLVLNYLFNNYNQALEKARLAEQYVDAVSGQYILSVFNLYHSLANLAVYSERLPAQQQQILATVAANQKKMHQWLAHAPMNFQHKYDLVAAEYQRAIGEKAAAIELYDRAIAGASANGYLQEEAIANELAAKFYNDWGKEKIAQAYLQDAYYCYARWGAKAKTDDLERRYPQLLQPILVQKSSIISDNLRNSAGFIDLAATIKASQAISKELVPEQLIVTLMQVVLENAGAEKGALILLESERLTLVLQCSGTRQCDLQPVPLNASQTVPITAIDYVFRTGETLVIDRFPADDRFATDPYIIRQQPKSFLCLPLLKQNQPMGVVYLENNSIAGAFTSDRLQVLQVLGAQAAISFENATLYQNLQASHQALQQSLAELQTTQTQLVRVTEKLQHDALHDALTNLPNRACFFNLLEHAIELNKRHPHSLYAVMFIDLDRFKAINDSLGHAIGDEFLKSVARRLLTCVRTADPVARFGGDEFAILLEELNHPSEAIEVAKRIHRQLSLPFNIEGYEVFTGASIGIALSTMDYQQAAMVLRDADMAMYQAKAQGKNCYVIFDPAMQTQVTTRLQLENDLRRAIESREFCLYYQPIISLCTGDLRGFEALVRWHHPQRGLVLPNEFIPIAEETGLIGALGWWVLQEACEQLSRWLVEFPRVPALVMNVNLSATQLKQIELLEQLEAILRETQIPRDCFKIEITESCILETFTSEARRLKQLKALGIKLCIDDFGTGYSSLSRLHEFPIDTLKIDRSFVHRLSANAGVTIQTIVTLAHSLGMDVVAEGIETTTQLEMLKELNCELGQGYLFSPPIDSQTATQWLRR
jgi:diguanylate cyclase (GGDEF)-like protein